MTVEALKCLRYLEVEFLTRLFNRILDRKRLPEEWRKSTLVPIFKNEVDIQNCGKYRSTKLMSHTMKPWERVTETRPKKVVKIDRQQYGFMPWKSTADASFA